VGRIANPTYYGTDDCSVDFVPRDPPTPGSVPLR
jgi:hypothetical protein